MNDNYRKAYKIPMLTSYKYHAFVTHASEDREFAEDLVEHLESAGFRILLASRDFLPGSSIISEMDNAIYQSRRTILIISPSYLKSKFCEYESALASDRSIRKGKITLIPIMYKMEEQDVPERFKWINYLDPEDKAYYWCRLCKALSDPAVRIETTMPVLHIAQGLAWSFFYGYLNFLLTDHTSRAERSKWWDPDPKKRRMSHKLFILIPESCYCYPTFEEADRAFSSTVLGHLEKFTYARGGKKHRDYTTAVHKLTDSNGEVYYFTGEYAVPLLSIYEMAEGRLAGLTREDIPRQVVTFYHTLQNILCHTDAKHCHGKFHIFLFKDQPDDGSRFPLAAELSKVIKEEIKKEINEELCRKMSFYEIA